MSRPDDVSHEAWDTGREIYRVYHSTRLVPCPGLPELVARAITAAVAAEREACAAVAEALERGEREWVRDSLWANIKADTARAIRARGKP